MSTTASNYRLIAPVVLLTTLLAPGLSTGAADPARIVAALDTEYQAAVERNDWQVMDRILHSDFTLVLGNGTVVSRTDLIDAARKGNFTFDKQVEMPGTQTVRMYGGDTAMVTALLWLKGKRADAGTFDYKLWFTDTYVRTAKGWRYAFGQASMRLPPEK
ncbi:MAG: nuclear transport factor 2 family protein [Pseudomonadota bacterium]